MDTDDLSALEGSLQMLEWLHPDPLAEIRSDFERWLSGQVPGTELIGLKAIGEPHWRSGGKPSGKEDGKMILVRTGVAFRFEVKVKEPDGTEHELSGVYTWVGFDFDTAPKQRMWIDVDGDLDEFGQDGLLTVRIFGDAPPPENEAP